MGVSRAGGPAFEILISFRNGKGNRYQKVGQPPFGASASVYNTNTVTTVGEIADANESRRRIYALSYCRLGTVRRLDGIHPLRDPIFPRARHGISRQALVSVQSRKVLKYAVRKKLIQCFCAKRQESVITYDVKSLDSQLPCNAPGRPNRLERRIDSHRTLS